MDDGSFLFTNGYVGKLKVIKPAGKQTKSMVYLISNQ